jgi:GWxTD domain-containing protein
MIFLLVIVLLFSSVDQSFAKKTKAIFFVEKADFFRNNNETMTSVSIIFPYDVLTFFRDSKEYFSDYEVGIIFSKDNKLDSVIYENFVENSIKTTTYNKTNSRKNILIHSFNTIIPPSIYYISPYIYDKKSKARYSLTEEVEIKKFNNKKVQISDILFYSISDEGSSLSPNIFAETSKNIFYKYEVYVPEEFVGDTLDVEYSITTSENRSFIQKKFRSLISTKPVIADSLELSGWNLDYSKYDLKIKVNHKSDSVFSTKKFFTQWSNLPNTVRNITQALESMKYIINDGAVYDSVLALSKADQREYFDDFWELRDPSKGTKLNELMNEYFKRVSHANKTFSIQNMKGWKTDRGIVLITYGFPDEIVNESDSRKGIKYEVWHYYAKNKKFIFKDRNGFGDFQLITPFLENSFN